GRGARVDVWRLADKVHPGGWAALLEAGGRPLGASAAQAALAEADLVLDAVFGLGARPGLPPAAAAFAAACQAAGTPVVSADLPSGLAADAARPAGLSFQAAVTVSFGAWKPCHELEPARSRCGARRLVDIGLTLPPPAFAAVELADLAARWPWPGPGSDKYSRGAVGLDTGSTDYPGAAVLSVLGAVYAGAGLVRYAGPARAAVLAAAPNVICPPPAPAAGLSPFRLPRSGWPQSDLPQSDLPESTLPTELSQSNLPQSDLQNELSQSDLSRSDLPLGLPRLGLPPAGQAPVGQAAAGQAPTGQAPTGQAAAGQASAGQAAAGSVAGRVQAWVAGSGWGSRPDGPARLAELAAQGQPLVVDAEAIWCFGESTRRRHAGRAAASGRSAPRNAAAPGQPLFPVAAAPGSLVSPVAASSGPPVSPASPAASEPSFPAPAWPPVLLTPHAGELARLLGRTRQWVEAEPAAAVQTAVQQTGATVLLKGATQYVATPGDPVTYLCFPGPAWTAQAGSGDVLAGICGALLAAGLPPLWAALLGGSVQALAAVRNPGPYPPQDLARRLPTVIASLRP
ncbi:MAG: bifunctional ADP-dependent NAD(P)H-hydrate dehydratase/NAD(P)H-hydrate epimerase, partial [Propionibacteriaceae bacterium]|nr:bifunctional ADP-dependent NAD(P)H-hydrate dehydratase/NAD(P)H-hydrate epimerase [Propionibacteriaceae bacterium]